MKTKYKIPGLTCIRNGRFIFCTLALQMMLSACTSTDSHRDNPVPTPHTAGQNQDCAGSPLSEAEKEQIKLHELKPETPLSVLKGGLDEPGPLVFIGSFPPNTKFPTHYHNAEETLLAVSGSAYIGMYTGGKGGKAVEDAASGKLYRKGDKHFLPLGMAHWVITTDSPVVFKACTEGPLKITFLDPSLN